MAIQPDLLDLLDEAPKGTLDALLSPDQIYESDDPALFTRLREDNRFDRKGIRIAPKDLGQVFSAFSNGPSTKGGVVVIGLTLTRVGNMSAPAPSMIPPRLSGEPTLPFLHQSIDRSTACRRYRPTHVRTEPYRRSRS